MCFMLLRDWDWSGFFPRFLWMISRWRGRMRLSLLTFLWSRVWLGLCFNYFWAVQLWRSYIRLSVFRSGRVLLVLLSVALRCRHWECVPRLRDCDSGRGRLSLCWCPPAGRRSFLVAWILGCRGRCTLRLRLLCDDCRRLRLVVLRRFLLLCRHGLRVVFLLFCLLRDLR